MSLDFVVLRQDEQVFWLLTGESPETLKEGRLVTATVMSAGRDDARVRLTDFGGVEGIVKRGDVSSKGEDVSPADRMQRGQTISARCAACFPSGQQEMRSLSLIKSQSFWLRRSSKQDGTPPTTISRHPS